MTKELLTALTDYVLGISSLVWGILLWRSLPAFMSSARRMWAAAFIFTALASLTGGTWHGISRMGSLWLITYVSIPLASMLMSWSLALVRYYRTRIRRPIFAALVVKLAIVAAVVIFLRSDLLVYVDAGLTVIAIGLFGLIRGPRWLLWGSMLALVGGMVQLLHLVSLGPLDHNGVYHLIQLAAMYCWYRAGRHLHDAPWPV